MDVIYIGQPFSLWTEGTLEPDVHMSEAFQDCGFHVYPLNASDEATEICASYNWHTSFVQDEDELVPTEEFISENVLWEDFPLLYISRAAATTEDEYTQFVYQMAEQARENGLLVASEVTTCPEDEEDDPFPWREQATLLWSYGEDLPQAGPYCQIRLAFAPNHLLIRCHDIVEKYEKNVDPEQFMPYLLQGISQKHSLVSIIQNYSKRQ